MNPGAAAPSFAALIERVYAPGELPALHGEGYGVDRSAGSDGWTDGPFVFAHEPPRRWLLQRPPGSLRALGDDRSEIACDRAGTTSRAGVGSGWRGEPATWGLRFPHIGIILAELLDFAVTEPAVADELLGRPCWRVRQHGPVYYWFDRELPLILRYAAGGSTRADAQMFTEITELRVGSTGPLGPLHDPRLTARPPALDPAEPQVGRIMRAVRAALPESRGVEVIRLDEPDGTWQARFTVGTPAGEAEILVDRREMSAEPYERIKAGMVRGGEGRWELSLDHDPELDDEAARLLARRLARSLEGGS
ncbi:MAG: hypothetical protein GEV00_01835 [Actinophytocola sp.]|nr:hypothetical protein [Actinophytocola sp.]